MSNFARPITIPQNQLQRIDAAYRLAGVPVPTRAVGIVDLIGAEPTADEVAASLAAEAITNPDPAAFYAEALERIARAQAGDALKAAFGKAMDGATREAMPDLLHRTATDLRPAFDKLAKTLTRAAKSLPAVNPLDVDAAVEGGHAAHLKAARDALTLLGTYAAIYVQDPPVDIPAALVTLLPLVDLPETIVEALDGDRLGRVTVTPDATLSPTLTVRRVAQDAAEDIDATLVGIARGDYDGVSLSLATPAELRQRTARARDAYRTRGASRDEVRVMTSTDRGWTLL
ncbi:hypothetical protein N866_01795 [Actinotalea ferrariae CF5-4]|uniref:Uncharacterized protein n=1 Tax=Actinotalea ferrariae CF5-4 TaxID=948458 RepID=A0A021VQ46_9CELL|nr:hypothetical protein [Actinotalea ferrariae]EYR63271.1 hypothetical protein N866_01795 [Actinotalea ferrariae CF5-4]